MQRHSIKCCIECGQPLSKPVYTRCGSCGRVHNNKARRKPVTRAACQCGCGQPTKRRFAPGHNKRGYRLDPKDTYIVDPDTGCWNWSRAMNRGGYGKIRSNKRDMPAHRWVYEQLIGPIPEGLTLDHLCRNRRCVNPAHLEPVTIRENTRRGASTKLTPDDVRDIRLMLLTRKVREVATCFGVSEAVISLIRNGKHWQDVA